MPASQPRGKRPIFERRFRNRQAAGEQLAKALGPLDPATTVIFALPRGGVPVAAEIARAARVPLEVVLVRKIGMPGQEELALGAVVDGGDPVVVVNEDLARSVGYSHADVEAMASAHLGEIERRRALYIGERTPASVAGKRAIVVDDGIATGATARAAIEALHRRGAASVTLAVPAAPASTVKQIAAETDEVVCLSQPSPFWSVGGCYEDFLQVSDEQVRAALADAAARLSSTGKHDSAGAAGPD